MTKEKRDTFVLERAKKIRQPNGDEHETSILV